jgi:hypothetical protein
MRLTAGNPVEKMLKDRTTVLVCRDRSTKPSVTKVLESVGQLIILGVLFLPKAVSLRKLLGTESRQPEQVV